MKDVFDHVRRLTAPRLCAREMSVMEHAATLRGLHAPRRRTILRRGRATEQNKQHRTRRRGGRWAAAAVAAGGDDDDDDDGEGREERGDDCGSEGDRDGGDLARC